MNAPGAKSGWQVFGEQGGTGGAGLFSYGNQARAPSAPAGLAGYFGLWGQGVSQKSPQTAPKPPGADLSAAYLPANQQLQARSSPFMFRAALALDRAAWQ